jgi:hypothetical protein
VPSDYHPETVSAGMKTILERLEKPHARRD